MVWICIPRVWTNISGPAVKLPKQEFTEKDYIIEL